MISSIEAKKIKMQAFNQELEKIAGPTNWLVSKLLGTAFGKNLAENAGKFISRYGTEGISAGKMFSSSGKVFREGMDAYKTQMGKGTMPNFFGFGKEQSISGFTKIKPGVSFKDDPLKFIGNKTLEIGANTLDRLRNVARKGVWGAAKDEINRAKYFTKEIKGADGTRYKAYGERSAAGKILNPVFDTGIGFGGMALLSNKYDDKGEQRSLPGRVMDAGKETLKWSVFKPITMAKFMAVDVPRMAKNTIFGKKENNNGF